MKTFTGVTLMPEKIKFKESQITKRSLARASSEAGDRRKQRPGDRKV